jgi:hypothetical protein
MCVNIYFIFILVFILLLLCQETVAKFREQLESRRRKRARKQREERRRERRIEAEENRLMGRFPGPMVRIESAYHYPQLGGVGLTAERTRAASPAESVEGSAGTGSPDLGTSPVANSAGPSFAKVTFLGLQNSCVLLLCILAVLFRSQFTVHIRNGGYIILSHLRPRLEKGGKCERKGRKV